MSTTAGRKLQMAILTIPMMMMITRDKVDFCFSVAFGLYSVYISCEIRVAGASAITAKEERSTPKNPAASNAMTGFGSRSKEHGRCHHHGTCVSVCQNRESSYTDEGRDDTE